MTPLRQRLIEEIALRAYSEKTRDAYVYAVACLGEYYKRSPDLLTALNRAGRLLPGPDSG